MEGELNEAIHTGLTDALSALNGRVVLPGGDVFFFSNPVLDDELNFACALQYKAEQNALTAATAPTATKVAVTKAPLAIGSDRKRSTMPSFKSTARLMVV